jgi:penicillin-binding protein 1A
MDGLYHGANVDGGTYPADIWHAYMSLARGGFCGAFPPAKEPFVARPFSGTFAHSGIHGELGTATQYPPTSTTPVTPVAPAAPTAPPATPAPTAPPSAPTGGGGGNGGQTGNGQGGFDPGQYESPPAPGAPGGGTGGAAPPGGNG